jgi:hypothetical protein
MSTAMYATVHYFSSAVLLAIFYMSLLTYILSFIPVYSAAISACLHAYCSVCMHA